MSLINCNECNNKASDTAVSCPHCGAPNNKMIRNRPIHNSYYNYEPSFREEMEKWYGGLPFAVQCFLPVIVVFIIVFIYYLIF